MPSSCRLKAKTVTLDLNGQTIYERPLESTLGRQFGLFHYKDQTAAQARNIVLRGNWPEALSNNQLADLLAADPSAPGSESIRRARHAVIGEPLFALGADEVLAKVERLPADERYALLADWVLPTPDHPVFRLEGDFSVSFPPPGLSRATANAKPVPAADHVVRIQQGGEPRVPAIELVDTAKALGKLDELAKRIEAIGPQTDSDRGDDERGKRALLALIQIIRGDDAAAAQGARGDQDAGRRELDRTTGVGALARNGADRASHRAAWPASAGSLAARRLVGQCEKKTTGQAGSPSDGWALGGSPLPPARPREAVNVGREIRIAGGGSAVWERSGRFFLDSGDADYSREPRSRRAHSELDQSRPGVDPLPRPRPRPAVSVRAAAGRFSTRL